MTQYALAKALSVSQPTVSAWINGRKRGGREVSVYPSYAELEKLCVFLEVSPAELIEVDPAALPHTYQNFPYLAAA